MNDTFDSSASDGADPQRTTTCGFVAVIGRPNVGKSTLINHLLGQKLSITSRKPQTTQHCIRGVLTGEASQIIFVDTPGLNNQLTQPLSRTLNKAALSVWSDVDAIVWVCEAMVWTEVEDWILAQLQEVEHPVILVLSKIDKLADKEALLPFITSLYQKRSFRCIVPVSALKEFQLSQLKQEIEHLLPESVFLYDRDQLTDRPLQFQISEMVREKIVRQMGDELPYVQTVVIEQFEQTRKHWTIHAMIVVERQSHKRMIIGKGGQRIKQIGMAAREDMQKRYRVGVELRLWVKVRPNWTKRPEQLLGFGIGEE